MITLASVATAAPWEGGAAWKLWSFPLACVAPEMPRKPPKQDSLFSKGRLYYGDNLRILRNHKHIREESVDLVYLDPPFKPTERYNLLFKSRQGLPAAAQVRAFTDTWRWDEAAAEAFHDVMENAPESVGRKLQAMHEVLGDSDMFAYLCMMTPRLVELRRVMKDTASIWLHCDTSASSELKILMDIVFGPENCRTIVTWKRTTAHSDGAQGRREMGRISDVLLYYSKGDRWTWNASYVPYNQQYIATKYRHVEPGTGRRYRLDNLTGPGGADRGNPKYEVMGVTRHWRYSQTNMERLIAEGRVVQTKPGAVPQFKRYLDEMRGVTLQDVWDDIRPINSQALERKKIGYPTQKPEALLERIIRLSSNEGDLVLDPFCGCGTAIAVAHREGRMWVGIDIAEPAIRVVRGRLGETAEGAYTVWGEPESVEDAETLAREDPYQFQWWAVRRLGAVEVEHRKGADRGIDGRLILRSMTRDGRFPQAIISVKAGKPGPAHVRDLRGTLEREDAEIGVLVTMRESTPAMRKEAASAGSVARSPWVPRIQLLSVAEIFEGKQVEYHEDARAEGRSSRAERPKARIR
jgi:DNA modification methylase